MTGPIALLLDVDTGIDDSLALLYAAASSDVELVAVTCVSGNVEARQVAINTLAVLELAGRTDVEVAAEVLRGDAAELLADGGRRELRGRGAGLEVAVVVGLRELHASRDGGDQKRAEKR